MAAPIAATDDPAQSAEVKQPGPPLWLSIAVFLIGAALIAIGGTLIVNRVLESSTVDSFSVPGQQTRQLEPGEYDVFGSTGGITDFSSRPSFSSADVTVIDVETGESLVVSDGGAIELSINRQTTRYERVAVFTVTEPGRFAFEVAPIDGSESRAVVARSLLESFGDLATPLILIGVGTAVTVIGVIMIIVGIVRRGRSQRAQRGFGATPGIYQAAPPSTPGPQASPHGAQPPQNSAPPLSPTPPPAASTPPPAAPTPPQPPSDAGQSETNTPW